MNATKCPTCGARVILAGDELGSVQLVDLEPVAGGEFVLRRSINSAPMASRATAYDVGAHYHGHRCVRPTKA